MLLPKSQLSATVAAASVRIKAVEAIQAGNAPKGDVLGNRQTSWDYGSQTDISADSLCHPSPCKSRSSADS